MRIDFNNLNFAFRDFLHNENKSASTAKRKDMIDLGESLRENLLKDKNLNESEEASKTNKDDSLASIYSTLEKLYAMLEKIQNMMKNAKDANQLAQLSSQAQQIMGQISEIMSKLSEILEEQ